MEFSVEDWIEDNQLNIDCKMQVLEQSVLTPLGH